MATARKRGNAYQIRVSLGYDLYGKQIIKSTTWTPPPEMTKQEIRKELERHKIQFEDECFRTPDVSNIKFEPFAEHWFQEYAMVNLRQIHMSASSIRKSAHMKHSGIFTLTRSLRA